ncbi:Cation channel sperm-associated protein subunit beta [Pteropus alecto]|uniref:Cation channel sperm-associated protein subunit beta n=1 Tax=Pteropus alecto TaxID=9402 RepID=L5JSG8_PTEAL|nr:Cation channel sperm-associated protein subunit beta [Pteropus alecto]
MELLLLYVILLNLFDFSSGITYNKDTAAVEEWLVRITLQHGLNIYTSEGTLLDRAREPILQWKLGTIMTKDDVKKLYPHVVGLKVTKCPCANDVALIGFLLNSKSNGIYIGLSFSGFWNYNNITWYNLTDMIYSEVGEVDYVTVTFERNRTLSEESSCFYSKEPFHDWLPCLPHISKGMKTISSAVITFLVDQEHSSGVFLLRNQKEITTSVHILKNNKLSSRPKFPRFTFPSSFYSPVGMVFHPRSHFLYAYGNQVWLSIDGGNTFELLADFHNDIIKNTYHSFYTSDITLVSQNGKVYLTKAGLERYSEVGSITDKIFTLYYDHMGFIHKLTPDRFEDSGSFTSFGNSKGIFGQAPNMGFETALAPQYITLDEMIFYAYVPENENQRTIYTKKFNNIHSGKVIHSRKTGTAYIRKILQHDTPKGFLSSVIAEVIDPFGIENVNESPCLSSSLSINPDGNFYKLTLQLQRVVSSFQDSDIEKTVVIPGYSSFLITRIIDDQNALAIATMPIRAPENMIFVKDTWFLYNFGQRNGQTWSIYEKPCNYWFQQHDDLRSLNVLKYVDLGKSQTLKVEVIPDTKGVRTLEIPLLKVIVGNPTLLEVKAKGSFDDTYSYLMEVSAASTAFQQGSTSLAFVVWGASTDCFVTTFVPTLKSSCSYLKSMHHIPSKFIPPEDWISGVHTDSQGFNMIKTLPKSGKFKQCANVSTREECNCTNDQKFSHAVAFSDCREKLPRPVADISAKTCGLSRKLFNLFPKENRLKSARLRSPQNSALWVLSSNGGPEGTLVVEGEPRESPRLKWPGGWTSEPRGQAPGRLSARDTERTAGREQARTPGGGGLHATSESLSWADDEHRARRTHTPPSAHTTVRAGSAREPRAVTGATSVPPPPHPALPPPRQLRAFLPPRSEAFDAARLPASLLSL